VYDILYRSAFPSKLNSIPDCPDRLNYIGEIGSDIFGKTLGVVGSRKMTSYGRRVVERLIGPLAASGVTIVSGFMYGVDSYAHEVCLDFGGRTIAVLPYGIRYKRPHYQRGLYERILDSGGLVISEFDEDFPPAPWTFPKRNRIVAGLSDAVLVVEAAQESGSLITADLCLKYGRKLFAAPGPIDSVVSEGTNFLIQKGAAEAVTSAEDILRFFGLDGVRQSGFQGSLEGDEKLIFNLLSAEPLNVDQISEKTGIDAATVGYKTMEMCLLGVLKEQGGRFYVC